MIVSCCQVFHFRALSIQTIAQHLQEIADAEAIAVSYDAFQRVIVTESLHDSDLFPLYPCPFPYRSITVWDVFSIRLLTRLSPNSYGLLAILLAVLFWAVAANVAHDLFAAGVKPLELAGASAIIATLGLTILNSFGGCGQTRQMDFK